MIKEQLRREMCETKLAHLKLGKEVNPTSQNSIATNTAQLIHKIQQRLLCLLDSIASAFDPDSTAIRSSKRINFWHQSEPE